MRTIALTTFLAEAEARARMTGVADMPVDALRNKGGGRSAKKRWLLARATVRDVDGDPRVVSYF